MNKIWGKVYDFEEYDDTPSYSGYFLLSGSYDDLLKGISGSLVKDRRGRAIGVVTSGRWYHYYDMGIVVTKIVFQKF